MVVTNRRTIPIEDFFVLPSERLYQENVLKKNELVTKIVLKGTVTKAAYREAREKESFDWAIFSAAVNLEMAGGKIKRARIGLGSASPVPMRVKKAEEILKGKKKEL